MRHALLGYLFRHSQAVDNSLLKDALVESNAFSVPRRE